MSTVQSALAAIVIKTVEELEDVPAYEGATISGQKFSKTLQFTPTGTPPVVGFSGDDYVIGGGGTTDVDLTALSSLQGALDGTGKKVQLLFVENTGGTALNVAPGATNAYSPYGAANDVDIPAGGFNLHYVPDLLADIAAGAKNLRFTGTAAATFRVGILLG